MNERRKYVIPFCRNNPGNTKKLNEIGDRKCPAREFAIADAIEKAEAILARIEARTKEEAGN